jgi:hypothetical protein
MTGGNCELSWSYTIELTAFKPARNCGGDRMEVPPRIISLFVDVDTVAAACISA